MKDLKVFIIVLFLFPAALVAQEREAKLVSTMKAFHQSMVNDHAAAVNYVDDDLSYGHSNGWIESRQDFEKDLGTVLTYHSIREDSIRTVIKRNTAYVRFAGDYELTMNGTRYQFHLRVLEIWVLDKKNWKLFARQAVR
jgi:hypothetical protein